MTNREFTKVIDCLPAGFTWGQALTPDIALHIVNAAIALQAQQPSEYLGECPYCTQEQEPESQWISVEERLPEKRVEFLALIFYKQRPHDKLIRVVRSLESDEMKVTHWMPLPPAPEGDV